MPRFFIENAPKGFFDGDTIAITGEDASHIAKVLRMKPGEKLTVCDCAGTDYFCEIVLPDPTSVTLRILGREKSVSEPDVKVTLYQGLPKGDKMELIIQKSVELGVFAIVPVMTLRSVSRPDAKSLAKKTERWNKIAAEAAKQSGRGLLPQVLPALSFNEAISKMTAHTGAIMLYEKNGGSIREQLEKPGADFTDTGILIGPEGGFDETEAIEARANGVVTAGLGPRILRTETAPLCALSAIMYATGNI